LGCLSRASAAAKAWPQWPLTRMHKGPLPMGGGPSDVLIEVRAYIGCFFE
jgi:hypothetical protein